MHSIITDEGAIDDLFGRFVENVYPSLEKAREIFLSGKKLSFYLGVDPTGPDIHIGHATNLLWLKKFKELGHNVIFLIGDFTARIGDPTDKDATRKALTKEEVQKNMRTYLEQVHRILPEGSFSVRRNSEWLEGMTFGDMIQLASNFTVQQMLTRDMFQKRLENQKPIFLHEFFYPLMQGYDSVALDVDGEVGGNDQTFNMLAGRDLMKALSGKEKIVVTTKLLEDPDTRRKIMNKSEGTVISLNDTPQEIRRKVLMLNDSMISNVFRLCTEKPTDWIDAREQTIQAGENPKNFKEELAAELVRMFYGEEAVAEAAEAVEVSATGPLDSVLKETGLTSSMSEAKRLIDQGGVLVNGQVIKRWDTEIKKGDSIKVGKGRFIKVR